MKPTIVSIVTGFFRVHEARCCFVIRDVENGVMTKVFPPWVKFFGKREKEKVEGFEVLARLTGCRGIGFGRNSKCLE